MWDIIWVSSSSVDVYKKRLDAHWSKLDLLYNHAAVIGTGSRSFAQ